MDFNGLLLDSFTFAERVFQRVQTQIQAQLSPGGDAEPKSLEELLSSVLANRLTPMVAEIDPLGRAAGEFGHPMADHPANAPSAFAELLERDGILSAALGACVCWGKRADCPLCDGAGTPGWVRPDEHLYVTYVEPAVVAASGHHSSVHPPSFTPREGEADEDA